MLIFIMAHVYIKYTRADGEPLVVPCTSCKFVMCHLVRASAPVCPIPCPQLLLLSSYKPESFGDKARTDGQKGVTK